MFTLGGELCGESWSDVTPTTSPLFCSLSDCKLESEHSCLYFHFLYPSSLSPCPVPPPHPTTLPLSLSGDVSGARFSLTQHTHHSQGGSHCHLLAARGHLEILSCQQLPVSPPSSKRKPQIIFLKMGEGHFSRGRGRKRNSKSQCRKPDSLAPMSLELCTMHNYWVWGTAQK